MSGLRILLFIIDPNNDFCDILAKPGEKVGFTVTLPDGTTVEYRSALPVPGASADMGRLATFVRLYGHRLAGIDVTLDSHHIIDIAHPTFWQDAQGNHPAPFTIITDTDVENGIWLPCIPAHLERCLAYVRALKAQGNYPLCIWNPHALIGTWGHNVHEELNAALQEWCTKEFAMVNYITKGANPWTEHYGALLAEVIDPEDPSTMLNEGLLDVFRGADIILVGGEASSHCVKSTVSQISRYIGKEHVSKFHLLTDAMSPVPAIPGGPDFPAIAAAWQQEMLAMGMSLTTTTTFFS